MSLNQLPPITAGALATATLMYAWHQAFPDATLSALCSAIASFLMVHYIGTQSTSFALSRCRPPPKAVAVVRFSL